MLSISKTKYNNNLNNGINFSRNQSKEKRDHVPESTHYSKDAYPDVNKMKMISLDQHTLIICVSVVANTVSQ